MAMDPLSMKSVLDRVELLEKSYQEERLAVRRNPRPVWPLCSHTEASRAQRMMIEGEITKERSEVRLPH